MGMCKGCSEVFSVVNMIQGYCQECCPEEIRVSFKKEQVLNLLDKEEKEKKKAEFERVRATGFRDILATTETFIDLPIDKRINIVSTQRIYGINIIKDIFGIFRDIIGGRVDSLEKALQDAHNDILIELKEKAYLIGGDAVVGIKIEHTYNNANAGSILSVSGVGTAVKLK